MYFNYFLPNRTKVTLDELLADSGSGMSSNRSRLPRRGICSCRAASPMNLAGSMG